MNKQVMLEFLNEELASAKNSTKEWKWFGPRYIGNVQICKRQEATIKNIIKIVKAHNE